MGDLVDKCVIFIAQNLEEVLQTQCVFSGLSGEILTKLAACVHLTKLDDVYDKRDKLKTKLFQRKIEFMFDVEKYKRVYESSPVLVEYKKRCGKVTAVKATVTTVIVTRAANDDDEKGSEVADANTNECKLSP